MCGEDGRIFRPLDDIDLLTTKFANDRLDTRPLHTNAGANRIDVTLIRNDRDLRPLTRLANDGLDDDRTIVNLWHFHLEEPFEQFGTRP